MSRVHIQFIILYGKTLYKKGGKLCQTFQCLRVSLERKLRGRVETNSEERLSRVERVSVTNGQHF